MHKLILALSILSAMASAQDLDAIMLDLYGNVYGSTEPDYTDITEAIDNDVIYETTGYDYGRSRRQVPLETGIACQVRVKSEVLSGRCVLFADCFRRHYTSNEFLNLQKGLRICESTGEVCCPV